jgi:hypothetical protein
MGKRATFTAHWNELNPDYRGEAPIEDVLLLLHLLGVGGDRTRARLMIGSNDSTTPYVEIMHFGRNEHTRSEYYPVADDITKILRDGYIEGAKQWGLTSQNEFGLTEDGRRALSKMEVEFAREVREYLTCEHPEVLWQLVSVHPRLFSHRSAPHASDFFIGIDANLQGMKVRRTRGTMALVRQEK